MGDETREAINADILEGALTNREIATKYGRSEGTISVLRSRLKAPRRRSGPQPLLEGSCLSSAHRAVGVRITLLKASRPVKELAEELGVSPLRVRQMELGQHDFRLSELIKLRDLFGIAIDTMLNTKIRKEHHAKHQSAPLLDGGDSIPPNASGEGSPHLVGEYSALHPEPNLCKRPEEVHPQGEASP